MLLRRPLATLFGRARRPDLSWRRFGSRTPAIGSSILLDHHSGHILSERQECPNGQKNIYAYMTIRPLLLPESSTAHYIPQMHDPTNHIITSRKPDIRFLARRAIFQAPRIHCSALTTRVLSLQIQTSPFNEQSYYIRRACKARVRESRSPGLQPGGRKEGRKNAGQVGQGIV